MILQQAIADFLEHGQTVRNLSDRTIRAYQSDLVQFHTHLMSAQPAQEITQDDLENYVEKLGTGSTYRDTSIRRKVAALKVFFRYLEDNGVVNESPARKLKIKRPIENRVPVVLAPREIKALLAAPKEQIAELEAMRDQSPGGRNRYFCAVRDNVIVELLFSTGIRIGELVALDAADVDVEQKKIQITGRATRGRAVSIAAESVIAGLRAYMTLRNDRQLDTPALFVGRSGTRLTIYSIENIFKKHVRLAEIKRHITPHALRHTMAAMLVGEVVLHVDHDERGVRTVIDHSQDSLQGPGRRPGGLGYGVIIAAVAGTWT